jgi:hypothetical protein
MRELLFFQMLWTMLRSSMGSALLSDSKKL